MRKLIILSIISLILPGCSDSINGELIFVEPSIENGFEFPYFLFIPDQASQTEKAYVIVEPNNTGFGSDDLKEHAEKAKRTASLDYYLGNYLSQNLLYPLVVPVFPRPKSEWKIYTHALDRDAMLQKDNALERLDNQLIEMFKDAQSRLKEKAIQTHNQFLLTGFSASGTFANRFTLIHPDRVFAVAAGGLNGLLMLPLDSMDNEVLNYPVGTNDLEILSNKLFEDELFLNTPQFYFMGQLDDNDALPYDDAFDQDEREQIFRLLGRQMLDERWNNCMQVYKDQNVNVTFSTYEEVGHKHPEIIKKDIVNFFKESIKQN